MSAEEHEDPQPAARTLNGAAKVVPIRPGIDPDAPMPFERGDHVELAEVALDALGPNPLTHDCGEFWRYAPHLGIWELLPGPVVRTVIAGFAGSPVIGGKKGDDALKIGANAIRGAESIMKDKLQASPRRVMFKDAPPGVVFADGFVTVKGGEIRIREHAPENCARHRFDFRFDPHAPTPLLDEFFEGIFADCSEEERADRVSLIQEFLGVCVIGEATRYERCLVLFATGGNGKSELLRIMRAPFPPEAVTSLAPQRWGDRFKSAMLVGKLANFVDELPESEIMSGESFKAIVTGNEVDVDLKNRDPFTHKPIAGHVFCTNSPISTSDHTEGFWRRPLIVQLTRDFEGDPERRHAASESVIRGELPAIVSWALRGAARRQTQHDYTVPNQSRAIAKEWRNESDVVRMFAMGRAMEEVRASEIYDQYKEWAKKNGYAQMSINKFGRRLMASKLYTKEERSMGVYYIRRPAP